MGEDQRRRGREEPPLTLFFPRPRGRHEGRPLRPREATATLLIVLLLLCACVALPLSGACSQEPQASPGGARYGQVSTWLADDR